MKMPFTFAHLRPGAAAGPTTVPPGKKAGPSAETPSGKTAAEDTKDGETDKDEDEETEDAAKSAAAIRAAERGRCAAIFASPAAAGRVEMAATLAFGTDLTSAQAIAVLQTAPAAATPPAAAVPANPFAAAMDALGNPPIAPDAGGGGGDETAAEVAAIMNLHAAYTGAKPAK